MRFDFEQTVGEFISTEGLIHGTEKIVLAVSGGADSIAMMYCLWRLGQNGIIANQLCAVHVNHGLRGIHSDGDEEFVKEYCNRLSVPLECFSIDVKGCAQEFGLSIESAGRRLRREVLLKSAAKAKAALIATGHHRDDQAETVIHRLARGCGYYGLCGIWPQKEFENNTVFIRPLLCVGREDIVEYCCKHGLTWRHDASNDENYYTRNRIRNRIIPKIQKQCTQPVGEMLARLSQKARHLQKRIDLYIMDNLADAIVTEDDNTIKVSYDVLCRQRQWISAELIRRIIVKLKCSQRDISRKHYDMILKAAAAKPTRGKQTMELPAGLRVICYRGMMYFKKNVQPTEIRDDLAVLQIPGKVVLGEWEIEAALVDGQAVVKKTSKCSLVEVFDLDRISLPIYVRPRQAGDKFVPLGMKTDKKVGKFLTNAKVEFGVPDRAVIICDSEKIIWVAPVRPSDETKVSDRTKRQLQITLKPLQA